MIISIEENYVFLRKLLQNILDQGGLSDLSSSEQHNYSPREKIISQNIFEYSLVHYDKY